MHCYHRVLIRLIRKLASLETACRLTLARRLQRIYGQSLLVTAQYIYIFFFSCDKNIDIINFEFATEIYRFILTITKIFLLLAWQLATD